MAHNVKVISTVKSLCATCDNSLVYERQNGDVSVMCSETGYANPREMPHDIVRCNGYRKSNEPSKTDFEKIAWEIKHDKRTGAVTGFQPPTKKKQEDF